MLSDTDFADLDESYWSSSGHSQESLENDLQLAAQLGKVLLERNRDLEEQIKTAQLDQYERNREVELLTRQLEVLRSVNESRMRLYEDVDRNLQELEKQNKKNTTEARLDKEKIKALTETIEDLDMRNESLVCKLNVYKNNEKQSLKQQFPDRRACSVSSLLEAQELRQATSAEYPGFGIEQKIFNKTNFTEEEKVIAELKESGRKAKEELSTEKKRRVDVEKALGAIVTENQLLEDKIMRLEHDQRQLQTEIHNVQVRSAKSSKQSEDGRSVKSGVDDVDIEHDDVDLPVSRARLLRLKSGGSAFGSRESLQNLGLETDEISSEEYNYETVSVELSLKTPSRETLPEMIGANDVDSSVTLLSELENQYMLLVNKYEAMIEVKSQRKTRDIGTQNLQHLDKAASKTAERPSGLDLKAAATSTSRSDSITTAAMTTAAALLSTPPYCPRGAATTVIRRSAPLDFTSPVMSSHSQHSGGSPPEYKRLFREIFDTLQRSVVYEDKMNSERATQIE